MYKHIIWDFDGTLFDTYPWMARAFKETLESRGIDEPAETIEGHMRVSASTAYKHYEQKYGIDEDFLAAYNKKRSEAEMEHSKPYEEIEAVCTYIAASGRKNYLFTHKGITAVELLQKAGIADCFTECITAERGFARKPSPDAIHHLIEKHRMKPEQTIMIGDRDLDLLSGKHAGISACYFSEKKEESDHADYTLHDFKELYSIL
ncbi:HAD-IA family hydrolase [Halobacillus sp. BAB-2008]|uniref:HAD-IA family hydrolase n=1 Tax=Halobacillus sp. BAB-2008 TaxID=1246484 RepID=UPI0002A51069|nr:HAD-IA family hydrolase [Halobacillus sp. BAB-2008]ELK48541.1 phosphatase [Halobacillus sp. BAB-2008]